MLEARAPEWRCQLVGARVVDWLGLERLAGLALEAEREPPVHCLHVVLADNPAGIARIDIFAGIAALHQLNVEQTSHLGDRLAHAVEVAHFTKNPARWQFSLSAANVRSHPSQYSASFRWTAELGAQVRTETAC